MKYEALKKDDSAITTVGGFNAEIITNFTCFYYNLKTSPGDNGLIPPRIICVIR